jgi:hypothetical protein
MSQRRRVRPNSWGFIGYLLATKLQIRSPVGCPPHLVAAGRTAASTGRYWMVRSCILAGHAPAARAGRHSSCPIQDELGQAWKWQCLVHEASRMVLLSAGERKGAVRCQTHIVQSYHLTTCQKSEPLRIQV